MLSLVVGNISLAGHLGETVLDDHSLYKSIKSSVLETLLFISIPPSIDFYWVTNCKNFYTKICETIILDFS